MDGLKHEALVLGGMGCVVSCLILFVAGLWKDGEFGKVNERLLSAAVLISAIQVRCFQCRREWAAHAFVTIVPGEAEQISVPEVSLAFQHGL